jgi:8-oxo-dGTP pyrophosphatase MutT (NUDIX family)
MKTTNVTDAQLPRGAGSSVEEVTPIPAASVIVLRGEPFEVLLMRRSESSTFAPGAWVFPGGALEEQDRMIAGSGGESDRAHLDAMKICAMRELFEETGVLLSGARNGPAPSPETLLAERARFSELVTGRQLNLDELVWTARWITPSGIPKRFDTWFFLTQVHPSTEAVPEDAECVETIWIRPDEALRREKRGDLILLFPTIKNLEAIATRVSAEELIESRRGAEIPVTRPILQIEGKRKRIVLPDEL